VTDWREYAAQSWFRARKELEIARAVLSLDPNSAANRAYYAGFHAVTALFALEGKSFSKHTTVRAAVHNELVKTGRWPVELGASYNDLMSARHIGDYGGLIHVSREEAEDAIAIAETVILAAHRLAPDSLPF
jgi:uncharacterized protein (UPF0332 family)